MSLLASAFTSAAKELQLASLQGVLVPSQDVGIKGLHGHRKGGKREASDPLHLGGC